MTTPSTSTPEPTGEALDYIHLLLSQVRRSLLGKIGELEEHQLFSAHVKVRELQASLPTAPAAPARDEEMEAHARPIPEAARINLEEAQKAFGDISKGQDLPNAAALKVWDCIVMAKSFLGEPAAPLPGGADLREAVGVADLEWLLNVAETYYGKGTNVECKAGVQRAERVRASLLVPAPSNTQERK